MQWSKIKHKRKFKRYLIAVAKGADFGDRLRILMSLFGDRKSSCTFFVKPSEEVPLTLTVVAVIEESNLFAIYGFDILDKIEKSKLSGDSYFSDFVSFHDLYRGGDLVLDLPNYVQEFVNNK
jgi:hypothetical protein